jgi:hypothetical protein
MLKQAAARRLHGVRTLLITTRAPDVAARQELITAVEHASAADQFGNVEILEADALQLASIFEFVSEE